MRSLRSVLAALLVASCGAPAKHAEVVTHEGGPDRAAMSLPLSALTVRGELSVRAAGAWMPLAQGASIAGAREVKAMRRGAIVALGDAAISPVVFLRAGTRVALAQDASGVRVTVLEGRARIRRGEGVSTYIETADGEVIVTTDVMVDANPAVRSDVRPTGVRPRDADWSFALQQPEADAAGVGSMEARATADTMEPLELRTLSVDVKTAGDQALTEVTHVFHNSAAERREGTFRFPLPDGATLVGLAMEIDGKLVEGEIVEREKARAVYEKIVDEMLDPALLEWEQGNWFKLRVFPLEANGDKKIVIRYVAPLSRAAHGWEYGYAIAAPGHGAIGALAVTVDGQVALAQQQVAQSVDLVVPVAGAKVPQVMREERPDGTYVALRLAPSIKWGRRAMPPAPGRNFERTIAIVIDTSRSSLEARAQALEVLAGVVDQLSPTDRFVVLASDVEVQPSWAGYQAVSADALARATSMIEAIEPDGATDLGATFAALDARDPSDVIYIGDGIATWGEQRTNVLADLARAVHAPIDAALVGKGVSSDLWSEIAGATGGRAMVVRSQLDEQRFALAATQPATPRLIDAKLVAPRGAVLFPSSATTLLAGDDLVAVMKLPVGAAVPASLTLTGSLDGKPYAEDIKLTSAVATPRVAQRWARLELAAMEAGNAAREDIVALSTAHGVMSTYTSLLVLENDQAYKQYQIERKQQQLAQAAGAPSAPTVTGGDLDTLGSRRASLSPDEIQPGDPEIKIPAPQGARSVVVTFPFGETKLAVWDEDASAWMVRFLIDQQTADGVYDARVTITHADGHVEVLRLPYTVDTKPPIMKVSVTKVGRRYRITARQISSTRKDADRVEVVLPDGTLFRLPMKKWGVFEGLWTPRAPLTVATTLSVVTRDNALNQASIDVVLP